MEYISFGQQKFHKVGNSLVVSVPLVIVNNLAIKDGDVAHIMFDGERIIIEKKARKSK